MAILRKNKKSDYTIIDNNIFKNKKLSLKAKGMICTMLSLPDGWHFSEDGLMGLSNDTKYSIKSTLQELMEYGYLVRGQAKNEEGKFANAVYTIYEEPMCEIPSTEKPSSEKPMTVNRTTYKILNNNKILNNINNLNNNIFKKPTLEEVEAYCKERNNGINAEQFINFYESKGWMIGKNKMKDWKACVRTWESKNKKKEVIPSWFNEDLGKVEFDDDERYNF